MWGPAEGLGQPLWRMQQEADNNYWCQRLAGIIWTSYLVDHITTVFMTFCTLGKWGSKAREVTQDGLSRGNGGHHWEKERVENKEFYETVDDHWVLATMEGKWTQKMSDRVGEEGGFKGLVVLMSRCWRLTWETRERSMVESPCNCPGIWLWKMN